MTEQHRSSEIRRAVGEIPEPLGERQLHMRVEKPLSLLRTAVRALEVKPRHDRLNAHVILLARHDVYALDLVCKERVRRFLRGKIA